MYQNPSSRALFGSRPLGVPLRESFPELGAPGIEVLDEVLRSGRPLRVPRRVVGLQDLAGDEVVLSYVLAPYGRPPAEGGIIITAIDASAEARWEQSSIRNRLIADIAEDMNAAADPRAALQALATGLVPSVADLAAVFVTGTEEGDRQPRQPDALALTPELAAHGPVPRPSGPREPSQWEAALAAGETVLIPRGSSWADDVGTPASRAWLDAVGANGIAVVPLSVAGGLTGVLVLLTAGDRRFFTDSDKSFLEAVAARGGSAIAHVRTYRHQGQIALQLQHALLPALPPPTPDVTVAAIYVAGAEDVEVGGDWWDVVTLGAGRVAMGVGDVAGRGLAAALVMGQARAAMRAAGLAGLGPTEVLSVLDEQIAELVIPLEADHGSPPRFATGAHGIFEPALCRLRVANAGHPPLLVWSDGRVRVVEAPPGAPLGLQLGGWYETLVPCTPGTVVAMLTDGLVESRDLDIDRGIAAVAASLEERGAMPDLDEMAVEIVKATGRAQGHEDDLVLVLVRTSAAAFPKAMHHSTVHAFQAIRAERREVAAMLAGHHVPPDIVSDVQQALSELISNALEHGQGTCQVHVRLTDIRVVVEVTDWAFPMPVARKASSEAERGRGIAITRSLASAWGGRLTPQGKIVWAEFRLDR
jgi:anti-sigma regulatory factor (Ser/Thr protein kinase)